MDAALEKTYRLRRLVYLGGRGAQELSGRALREGTARRDSLSLV